MVISCRTAWFSHFQIAWGHLLRPSIYPFWKSCFPSSPVWPSLSLAMSSLFLTFKPARKHCGCCYILLCCPSPFQLWFSFTHGCQTHTSLNFVRNTLPHPFSCVSNLLPCSHLFSEWIHTGMQITLWIHRPINGRSTLKRTGPALWPVMAHRGLN